jgi:hypothetical protein
MSKSCIWMRNTVFRITLLGSHITSVNSFGPGFKPEDLLLDLKPPGSRSLTTRPEVSSAKTTVLKP